MSRPRRMTVNRAAVLQYLFRSPDTATWSYRVSKCTHVETDQVGRILAQLEQDGCADSWWAGSDETADGPRRHWFRLTDKGRGLRAEVLAFLYGDVVAGPDPSVLQLARARGDVCPACTTEGRCGCCGLTHTA